MRNIITVIVITFTLCSCNQNAKQEFKKIVPIKNNEKTIAKTTINNKIGAIKIEELNELIPIDTVDSKSKNIYKRYGLEFSGNCYACDLADLSITEKSIKLTNVCDEKQNKTYEVIKITNIDNGIELKTKQNDFIFTKIDKAPIYELKIIGNEIKNNSLRISKYFTLKKILNKFEQHDCGDFEG
jgi:hypothetical protein